MSTLIAVSALGIICLIIEIFNLRKILIPLTIAGLLAILGLIYVEYNSTQPLLEVDNYRMIINSNFSLGFSALLVVLMIFVIAMSQRFYKDEALKLTDYVSLKIFLLAGAIAMISYGNLIMFFLGLEVLSVAVYILASSNVRQAKSNEAGLKYFMMGAFASAFILFGIALIYGATATFDASEIFFISQSQNLPIWFNLGFVMLSVGMLFKASIFPFHFWAPDVYEGSPTLTTAMMSTVVKVAAIGTLFKLSVTMTGAMSPTSQTVIVILSILTLTVANITGLRQKNIKRMMAYSGISHAGFMLMALLAMNNGENIVLYYSAAYSFAAIAAFAVIMAVTENKPDEDFVYFNGLARHQPLMAGILALAMLSMGGIPIMAGFFAKAFLFGAMLSAGYITLVIFGVINSIIAIYYYFGVINTLVVRDSHESVLSVPMIYKVVAICAILLNIILGIFPGLIFDLSLA